MFAVFASVGNGTTGQRDNGATGQMGKGESMSASWTRVTGLSVILFALLMLLMIAVIALLPHDAAAQGLPSTIRGDIGLKSGTQAPLFETGNLVATHGNTLFFALTFAIPSTR
jgi:hypothetical protein